MFIPLVLGGLALLYVATKKKPGQATTMTGKSGTPYAVALSREGTTGGVKTSVYGVYLLPNGTPIMEYAVSSNSPTRTFLSSPMKPTDPILVQAKSDFL
jgi:hypothetical protein